MSQPIGRAENDGYAVIKEATAVDDDIEHGYARLGGVPKVVPEVGQR